MLVHTLLCPKNNPMLGVGEVVWPVFCPPRLYPSIPFIVHYSSLWIVIGHYIYSSL